MVFAGWEESFSVAITVCDREGTILYMNDKAAQVLSSDGGKALLGKNLFACHNAKSAETIRRLIDRGETNTYTIEKKGKQKLIHQAPWFVAGVCQGLVELSIELPVGMPHHVRD